MWDEDREVSVHVKTVTEKHFSFISLFVSVLACCQSVRVKVKEEKNRVPISLHRKVADRMKECVNGS